MSLKGNLYQERHALFLDRCNYHLYERAIAYLETSATAKDLIKLLMDSPEIFIIELNDDYYNSYAVKTRTINWDPTGGLILGNGKSVLSASNGLDHEMGHAVQQLSR